MFFLEAGIVGGACFSFMSCLSNLKMTGFSSLPNLTTAAKTTLPVREIMRISISISIITIIIIFIIIIIIIIIYLHIIIIIIRYFESFSTLFFWFFSNCDYTGNAEKWWLGFLGSPKMNGIVI